MPPQDIWLRIGIVRADTRPSSLRDIEPSPSARALEAPLDADAVIFARLPLGARIGACSFFRFIFRLADTARLPFFRAPTEDQISQPLYQRILPLQEIDQDHHRA